MSRGSLRDGETQPEASDVDGWLDAYRDGSVLGWCWDASRPDEPIAVELLIEGTKHTVIASQPRKDLRRRGMGNGAHGFAFVPPRALAGGRVYELRAFLAGTSLELKGSPLFVDLRTHAPEGVFVGVSPDGVCTGWAVALDLPQLATAVDVFLDGFRIGSTTADLFHSNLERLNGRNGGCAFEYRLPESALDGREHAIDVRFVNGGPALDASPQRWQFCQAPRAGAEPDLDGWTETSAPGDARQSSRRSSPPPEVPDSIFEARARSLVWPGRRLPRFFHWVERVFAECDAAAPIRAAVERDEAVLASLRDDLAKVADPPLVSIIMPTWNRAYVIAEAIQSVLDQSYQFWELWVCDDGSTDNTRAVVERFDDARIHYLQLAKANGAVARNFGMRAARGQLFAYLDSDNIWHPDYLAIAVRELTHNPGCPATFSGYFDVEITGACVQAFKAHLRHFSYADLLNRNYIDLNSLLHRRTIFDELGGFDESLARLQDWNLALRYLAYSRPLAIPLHLVLYRRNEAWDQVTALHQHRAELRERVRSRAMDALGAGRRIEPAEALGPDARVARVVASNALPATLLEAASLCEQLAAIAHVHVHHAFDDEPGAVTLARLVAADAQLTGWDPEQVGSDDLVLIAGDGAIEAGRGRFILTEGQVLRTAAPHARRDIVVSPKFALHDAQPTLEIPFNWPAAARDASAPAPIEPSPPTAPATPASIAPTTPDLLTLVRVSPSIFDLLGRDLASIAPPSVLLIDCQKLRTRSSGGDEIELGLQNVHALIRAADVWVDWEVRDAHAWLDVFIAQAMLSGCIVASGWAPPDHPALLAKAVRVLPCRDWRKLREALAELSQNGKEANFARVRAKVFGLSSFSDAAIRTKLAGLAHVIGRSRVPVSIARSDRRPRRPHKEALRGKGHAWDDGMLRLLELPGDAAPSNGDANGHAEQPDNGHGSGTLARKYRKLLRNPEAFFSDSRNPTVQAIGRRLRLR